MFVLDFMVFGAWGFWLLIVVSAIYLSELLDHDEPIWETVLAVVTMAILAVFGGINPIHWIMTYPWESVLFVAGYFVVGAVWSLIKWYFFLVQVRRRVQAIRQQFPDDTKDELVFRYKVSHGQSEFPPQVTNNKSRIIGWMSLWPASMLWTVINDPVRRACEEIFDRLGGIYQAINNRVFKDFQ